VILVANVKTQRVGRVSVIGAAPEESGVVGAAKPGGITRLESFHPARKSPVAFDLAGIAQVEVVADDGELESSLGGLG
jgi:hypothetical protein